jgi:hypothetical protein
MTPTGARVLEALMAVLVGYGTLLVLQILNLIAPESAGDRSPITVPPAGLSATPERGLGGDACASREALEDTSDPSPCRPSGDSSTVRPFSDPEAA